MEAGLDTEVLISEVQCRPVLWDPSNEDYKNRDLRNKAWEEICSIIIPTYEGSGDNLKKKLVEKLRSRWKSSRDSYMKVKGKAKVLKTGSAPSKPIKYIYYEQMKFLDKFQQRPTNSNFHPETSEDPVDIDIEGDEMHDNPSVAESDVGRELNKTVKEKKRQQMDSFGENILRLLKSSKETEDDADRSFLLSLLPHVKAFNEDQKLNFQREVLQLIMNIKRRNYAPIAPNVTLSGNMNYASYPHYDSYNSHYTTQTVAGQSQLRYDPNQPSTSSVPDPSQPQINYNHPHQRQSSSVCLDESTHSWESASTD